LSTEIRWSVKSKDSGFNRIAYQTFFSFLQNLKDCKDTACSVSASEQANSSIIHTDTDEALGPTNALQEKHQQGKLERN